MSLSIKFCGLCTVCLCLLSIPEIVSSQTVTDYMYVTDYGNMSLNAGTDNVLRYSFTATTVGGVTTMSAPTADPKPGMPGANFALGLEAMTGTQNTILTATATGINRYDSFGDLIGTINVTNIGGGAHTFNGIAGMAVSNDAQFLYVAEEGAGLVDKISLKTGAIVLQFSMTGAHDVALAPDGLLYVAGYSSTNGIVVVNPATMASVETIITNGADGTGTISKPTGMSFVGSAKNYTLYAESNVTAQNTDEVGVFTIKNANGNSTSNPVLQTTAYSTPGNLSFTFGNNIGPDGNLYIADLGDGAGTTMVGVTDGVYEYNIATGTAGVTTDYKAGYHQTVTPIPNPATTANNGILVAPKYVVFNTNFSPSFDPGTPEPGLLALVTSLGTVGFGVRRRFKNKR